MKFLRDLQDKQAKLFEKGGKLEKLYPLFEANDTILFTPGHVTKGASHVRDALDLKRMMIIVVIALIPCVFMAMYNTGLQANLVFESGGGAPVLEFSEEHGFVDHWRTVVLHKMGVGFSPSSLLACILHGALYYFPVLFVTFVAGGGVETIFAIVRKHEINEGFLVTGMLFPLILPPTIPLWQVAIGIVFGTVIGKEVFGGTGMNFLNPALTARVFLFFAYPAQISGELVWTAVDGFSGATPLAISDAGGFEALQSSGWTWMDAFLVVIPGSMGETSTLACLIGAFILIVTKIGSWRTMLGITLGTTLTALFFNQLAGTTDNLFYSVPFYWHFVAGGWAFGMVFMATDPVSSAFTDKGKWVYGFMIGVLVILIRLVNPAYPEGMMLAILLMNVFAPTIDHVVLKANIKRRLARNAAV